MFIVNFKYHDVCVIQSWKGVVQEQVYRSLYWYSYHKLSDAASFGLQGDGRYARLLVYTFHFVEGKIKQLSTRWNIIKVCIYRSEIP